MRTEQMNCNSTGKPLVERAALAAALMVLCGILPAQICADCNDDGQIDVRDALSGAQISAGLLVPTPVQLVVCDVDSSLTVTVLDALVMAQIAVGLPVVPMCPPTGPDPQWLRCAGGADNDYGEAMTVLGNVVYSAGTRDFQSMSGTNGWVSARDPDGGLRWEGVLSDPTGGQHVEMLGTAAQGSVIYAGGIRRTVPPPGPAVPPYTDDLVVVQLDAAGALLQQTLVDAPGKVDTLQSITVLADGSLLILATRVPALGDFPSSWVLNMETNGSLRWQVELQQPDGCYLFRAAERPTGGFYLAGAVGEVGSGGWNNYGWLVSMDANGGVLWQKQYDPLGTPGNAFNGLALDGTGIWLVGSMCANCFFRDDSWIVRVDLSGNLVASALYGDYAFPGYDAFIDIVPSASGGFTVVGVSDTTTRAGTHGTVHEFDASGAPLWTRSYGKTSYFVQMQDAVVFGGAVAFIGTTNSVTSPSQNDEYLCRVVPQDAGLDACADTGVLVDITRDILSGTMVSVPAAMTVMTTSETSAPATLTWSMTPASPVDDVHCTN